MKLINILILLVFMVFSLNGLFAADTTSTTIYHKEGDTWVLYYGTATFGSDSTANVTTAAMDISDCNLNYGGIQCYFTNGAGTEDANGIIMYSNDPAADLTYFSSTTYTGLDQIQVTTKEDTLGINNGTDDQFKRSKWMVLKFDGQAGNPEGSVVNWFVFLHKKNEAVGKKVAGSKATS